MSANFTHWLRTFHPAPADSPLVIYFPHAGGSASYSLPLSQELTPGVEIAALQYPGRQDRRSEPFLSDIGGLADAVGAALIDGAVPERAEHRPLAFFGHSMGAILAFETALRLAQGGLPGPRRLFVSGRRAPSTVREERVHLRDDSGLVDELRMLSGTDPRLLSDPDLLAMILPPMRADYRAIETYAWDGGEPVDCPITVLIGENDPKVTPDEARAWQRHTTRDCTTHLFPGGHFYLERAVPAIASLIRADLDAAR